jgi:hypothetical protein
VTLAKKVENDFDQIIQDEIGCNEMRVMWCLTTFPVGTGLLQGYFQRGLLGCCVNAACMKLPQHLKLH